MTAAGLDAIDAADDDALWDVLTSDRTGEDLPVVTATVTTASSDVAMASHPKHGTIIVPPSRRPKSAAAGSGPATLSAVT